AHCLEFGDRSSQAGGFGFADERSDDNFELQKVKGLVQRRGCACIERLNPVGIVTGVRQKQYWSIMVEPSNVAAEAGAASIAQAIANDVQVVNLIPGQP